MPAPDPMFPLHGLRVRVVPAGFVLKGTDTTPDIVVDDDHYALGFRDLVCTQATLDRLEKVIGATGA